MLPASGLFAILFVFAFSSGFWGSSPDSRPVGQAPYQNLEQIEDIDSKMADVLGHSPDSETINIYVFSDYDCPHCRNLSPRLTRLSENYEDDVKIYYVPYPALQREMGTQAAMATLCADSYGHRQEFVSYALDNWSGINSDVIASAYDLFDDVSSDEWQSCLTDDAMRQQQNQIIQTAQDLEITSVPTSVIDGYVVTGGVDYDTLEQIVNFVQQ